MLGVEIDDENSWPTNSPNHVGVAWTKTGSKVANSDRPDLDPTTNASCSLRLIRLSPTQAIGTNLIRGEEGARLPHRKTTWYSFLSSYRSRKGRIFSQIRRARSRRYAISKPRVIGGLVPNFEIARVMAVLEVKEQMRTVAEREMDPSDAAAVRFTLKWSPLKTELFCYTHPSIRAGLAASPQGDLKTWRNKEETIRFLQELPQESTDARGDGKAYPCFTFIAGHGNGTFKPLSLDDDLFERIMAKFQLPYRVREVIHSIHGVFVRFVEQDDESVKSVVILFSTPKSPVREVFLAMRVRVVQGQCSVSCFLFDCEWDNLIRTVDRIRTLVDQAGRKASPLALLTTLIRDVGCTSEEKRGLLDNEILEIEQTTRSTRFTSKPEENVRWPGASYQTISDLHKCHNGLVFVVRAIDAEINAWRQLRRMANDERLKPIWASAADPRRERAMLDVIDFELAHTESRKSQTKSLQERAELQINLVRRRHRPPAGRGGFEHPVGRLY
ncbi:hypothetical protein VTK73DRAFT_9885 [Phialemonium thermophilum]|uniref:Uncharacterized protein n=1 Tax=Phialemonium thermophilum TaxID=223376 RepID=A0ABR3VZU5_9PEZI